MLLRVRLWVALMQWAILQRIMRRLLIVSTYSSEKAIRLKVELLAKEARN